MEFSKNIKLNEYNDEQNNCISNKNSNISSIHIHNNISKNFNFDNNNNDKDNSDNLDISNLIDNKKTVKNNEEKEKEDREPYKKLFLISEYFQLYLNKTFHNYITINNNTITNEIAMEEQSKMSKMNRMTNRKNSVKINNLNFHKTIKRADSNTNILNEDKNITVNILNKEIKKKEISKSERINKNTLQKIKNDIEDDWVIYTGGINNNNNNNDNSDNLNISNLIDKKKHLKTMRKKKKKKENHIKKYI